MKDVHGVNYECCSIFRNKVKFLFLLFEIHLTNKEVMNQSLIPPFLE